ncbi:MAG: CheR family methyltransferase [Sphingorhabdus sp.]
MSALATASSCPFDGTNSAIFSRADFDAIAEIVYSESGNVYPEGKAMLVYSRLTKRLRVSRTTSFAEYIRLVAKDAEERRIMVNLLTTNHTYFYREEHHYDHFIKTMRPALIDKAMRGEPVRIWSAGCSSGEEVYALGMAFLGESRSEGVRIANKDIRFLASDLDDHSIEMARAATYSKSAITPVPANLRNHWTKDNGDAVVIAPVIQNLIRFRSLNLLHQWPFNGLFDAIFCRNVMIYFDTPTKEQLLLRFAQQLAPSGYLYIGHSERLSGPAEDYLTAVGKTIYQRTA